MFSILNPNVDDVVYFKIKCCLGCILQKHNQDNSLSSFFRFCCLLDSSFTKQEEYISEIVKPCMFIVKRWSIIFANLLTSRVYATIRKYQLLDANYIIFNDKDANNCTLCNWHIYFRIFHTICVFLLLKRTVISSNPPFKEGQVRFTLMPLKPYLINNGKIVQF